MGLTIPFDPSGLDPATVGAFDDLIAALQTWAGTVQASQGNFLSAGYATFLGQHRLRLGTTSASITTGVETPITFTAPVNDDLNVYDVGDMFDGSSTVNLTAPGLYIATGRIRWDANAAGTSRILQLRVGLDDSEFVTANAPVASMTQYVHGMIPVTTELLAAQSTGRISVTLEAAQDSGGTRSPSYVWFSVFKVA